MLTMLSCRHSRPKTWIKISNRIARPALAKRSTVTSTNAYRRHQGRRAGKQEPRGSYLTRRQSGQPGPGHATETCASTDKTEQPPRLSGVVDVVGQRPELTQEQRTEDLTEEVEPR